MGYSKKELENTNWKKITHPDDMERTYKISQSLLQDTIQQARFEKRYVHKNGTIIYADVSTFLQRDKNNNPQYFITSFSNVTDYRKAQIEREQFFRFFNLSLDMMVILEHKNSFKVVNPATLKILGYSEEELLSKPSMGFVHPVHEGMIEELGVELDGRGNVKGDTEGRKAYTTSMNKVFSAGDMRRGQSLVVWAIREGRQCAYAMDEYLMGYTSLSR